MKNVLLILAAGKSSRFGGYPKAFCKIGNVYVAQQTVDLGARYFDETYLAINRELYPEYYQLIHGCKLLSIGTGQGDSHSFLRAARLIKQDCDADIITLCWGDTFYLNDSIFRIASKIRVDETSVGVSLASIDSNPYAWYEPDQDKIKGSYFRDKDGAVKTGIHDQSIFVFNLNTICFYLELYMKFLGIRDDVDYINSQVSKEMKLLESFTYFYENNLLPMKFYLVEPGQSLSFNTHDELDNIKKLIKK